MLHAHTASTADSDRTRAPARPGAAARKTSPLARVQKGLGNQAALRLLQRKCVCGGEGPTCAPCAEEHPETIQRSALEAGVPQAGDVPEIAASAGVPVPTAIRARAERLFGTGFGDVRLHDDAPAAQAARRVAARAFTIGRDIYFGNGWYRPETQDGAQLLGHELAHVVQQRNGLSAADLSVASNRYEQEADRAGEAFGDGRLGALVQAIPQGHDLAAFVLQRKPAARPQSNEVQMPQSKVTINKKTGRFLVYVDDALILEAQPPASKLGGIKLITDYNTQSMKLTIQVALTPGIDYEINGAGMKKLTAKYPNVDLKAANVPTVQSLPPPPPMVILFNPEFGLRSEQPLAPTPPLHAPVQQAAEPEPGIWDEVGEWVHGSLDVVGFIPGIGEIADGINAAIYLAEGRYGEAAISAAAMIPIVGDLGKVGKWSAKIGTHALEHGTETLACRELREGAKELEKVGKEVKDVATEAEKATAGAEAKAEKRAATEEEKAVEKEEAKKVRCTPKLVQPLGGYARHNDCAAALPLNMFPGKEVLVDGRTFDALTAPRLLWEVKTENYKSYKTKFLKEITIARHASMAVGDMIKATKCGFGYMLGVTDAEELADLTKVIPLIPKMLLAC